MLSVTKFLFGPIFILFLSLASWSDFKEHKIYNSLILRILILSILLNLLYFFKLSILREFLNYLIYQGHYIAISFLLYFLDFWKAGDLKFFITIASFLHPQTSFQFIMPFIVFFGGAFLFIILEGVILKKIKFEFSFSKATLLPIITVPLMPFLGTFSLVFILLIAVMVKKFPRLKELSIPALIFSFLTYPLTTLGFLRAILAFTLISSFKFEGTVPSAPFLSLGLLISFIIGP